MSKFGKVAVLFGGTSAERDVSLSSGNAVLKALLNAGVDAHAFDPKVQAISEIQHQDFDRAFIVLHGRGGEDGSIQGALEHLGIPHTGSGVLGSALAMDKVRTKHVFKALGLATAAYEVICQGQSYDAEEVLAQLGGCAMVKPANEGSSIGMSKVENAQELEKAVQFALTFDQEVLVEQWITGREFTVAMLGAEALPVIEMRTPHSFYDYEAKYQSNSTEYYCPADLPQEQSEHLRLLAVKAFRAVGASGWGRVDAMQDEHGNFYLLEANTVPGMTEKSLVPMAAKAHGLNFEQLCLQILEQTLA